MVSLTNIPSDLVDRNDVGYLGEGERMEQDKGVTCCSADAARRFHRINVEGNMVGIIEFRKVMMEVRDMGLEDDDEIRAQLVMRTRIYNYVPPKAEKGYGDALLEEYKNTLADEG